MTNRPLPPPGTEYEQIMQAHLDQFWAASGTYIAEQVQEGFRLIREAGFRILPPSHDENAQWRHFASSTPTCPRCGSTKPDTRIFSEATPAYCTNLFHYPPPPEECGICGALDCTRFHGKANSE